jgi:hypothetical protein
MQINICILKFEIVGAEYCRAFCPGKITAAENLRGMTDSLQLFPSLQHLIASLVLSQKVEWKFTKTNK